MSKQTFARLLAAEDWAGLEAVARDRSSRLLRFLLGRLCSPDAGEKCRAVEALGRFVEDPARMPPSRLVELLRRFVWALSDESGTVPYGFPEAMGEVLARRPEFQEAYLPILGSYLTEPDMLQTGPIERGVMWGLGRVGPSVGWLAPHALAALETAARSHPEIETREAAARALRRIQESRPEDA